MLELAEELRRQIARRITEESGAAPPPSPSADHLAAADAAIAAWAEQGEEELDLHAFRPLTPLQKLLADHQEIRERIADIHDRRLS
ncbi:TilS substrate-binding domain-containing protein [Bosea sp. (in: a-proteobacteria)]|uniref:TilS substrate-binding domain-containing protein n=1 Tax=Bosea sp. (in: a-proteobacteria) TaxID=1871050 RepID=UPI003F71E5A1